MADPPANQPPEPLPPLKTDPRYGHYPWWPEDGDGWLHPEDVELARRTLPSPRIWRTDGRILTKLDDAAGGPFIVLHYGADRLRVRPRLWQEVPRPQFEIDDLVEVLPHGMQNDPVTGRVREVLWDDTKHRVIYQLDVADRLVETRYTKDDLKPVDETIAQPTVRVEPPQDDAAVDALVEGLPKADHLDP
ncbi:MAG: hypothetical protein AAGJ46_03935 [Planctomycetota bacterium]